MVGVAIFGANFLVTKNSFVKKKLMIKYPITKSFFCVKFIISDEIQLQTKKIVTKSYICYSELRLRVRYLMEEYAYMPKAQYCAAHLTFRQS